MVKSLNRTETQILLDLLLKFRQDAGLTQSQCSQSLGRPQSFMSDVERGIRRLDLVQMRELCKVFGTSLPNFVQCFENQLAKQERFSGKHKDNHQLKF